MSVLDKAELDIKLSNIVETSKEYLTVTKIYSRFGTYYIEFNDNTVSALEDCIKFKPKVGQEVRFYLIRQHNHLCWCILPSDRT